jgi:D-beta-D-heptose 7-phosphate kinase/D-beta-D-heptose 1-phosphate adenosyltransferase
MTKVWVNGCFDLIHLGHIEMLKYARSLGDCLHVGIDSDVRVSAMKGVNRPLNNELTRFTILDSFKFVDKVTIFDTDYQLEQYIMQFSPKYMVIGEEYMEKPIIGAEFCEIIKFFPRIDGFSTTLIAKKIKDSL